MREPLVVLGAGMASYAFVKAYRAHDQRTPLVVVTSDGGDEYSKPRLSTATSAGLLRQDLVQGGAADLAERFNVDVWARCTALGIDPAAKVLHTARGTLAYRSLVLASGARAGKPVSVGPESLPHLSINHLDDYIEFRAKVPCQGRVLIVGAGLVGCELAHDLAIAGASVTVVESASEILGGRLPKTIAAGLRQALASRGVKFHLGTTLVADQGHACPRWVELTSGVGLACDAVLFATGLTPDVELARAAGLAVGRGIAVDGTLSTNDCDICALGDCAEVEGEWQPFVQPLLGQARALAERLSGASPHAVYGPKPVVVGVKTSTYPVVYQIPSTPNEAQWSVATSAAGAEAVLVDQDNRMVGFALAGDACGRRREFARRAAQAHLRPVTLGGKRTGSTESQRL